MDGFANPKFCQFILGITQAYGDLGFWIQNLTPGANPDATWRALLVLGSLKVENFQEPIRRLLIHEDTRVRAWACFALGQLKDEAAVDQIHDMNADPSIRVRFHAWQAVQAIVGSNEISRCYPLRVPPMESSILISEDSRKIQCALTSLFRKLGFSVETASTEEETIDKALRLKPQAVITDNQKGNDNLSGLNLTWELSRKAELRETVLFMLTGDFIEPIFLWSGGDYFLSKTNCGLKDIGETVTSYLRY